VKVILIILTVILAALQYRLWFADDGLLEIFRLKHEISDLRAKNQEINKYNEHLINEIATLKKGGVVIENKARHDLGMIKEGEVFYQVIR
jgi:cell division protein FtsB